MLYLIGSTSEEKDLKESCRVFLYVLRCTVLSVDVRCQLRQFCIVHSKLCSRSFERAKELSVHNDV